MPENKDITCAYPQCYKCEFDYCIKDGQISLNLPPKKADRREYHKKYYRENPERFKENYKRYYKAHHITDNSGFKPRVNYVKYSDVTAILRRLKKQIGELNTELIFSELNKLEIIKYSKMT